MNIHCDKTMAKTIRNAMAAEIEEAVQKILSRVEIRTVHAPDSMDIILELRLKDEQNVRTN